ncbi:MAG: DUF1801 domain-containing protein [Winogradskyella sp.]|uniref:DUF1801 domain-containing protein n=1 Tax=Winogradskyella sp. TaxID=1883156 RepID=UPI000F3D7971|nr:DUF1801 domain-containing protein [Winogradskyella sp.]RNC86380.1 MAG: DUF1801 domain-containing protein [Winogradskyella sp.]
MAGLITKETNRSVSAFIDSIDNQSKRNDSYALLELISSVTGYEPKIWGNEKVPDFLIGFGKYKYKRKSGKEEFEWFNIGFAPRTSKLTVYLTFDINQEEELLQNLGKCKWGKGCLYINKLADVDLNVLKQLVDKSKDSKWH